MSVSAQTNGAVTQPPTSAKRYYTYDELCEVMPETNLPHELWDGELITSPSPSFFHQEVALRFYKPLDHWVAGHRLGKVIASPIDMVIAPSTSVQPGVAFIAKERLHIIERVIRGPVDLVAEVISEGSRQRDRIDKRDLYEQYGVKEYWILDPEARTVEVLFLENNQYRLAGRWREGEVAKSVLLPGFEVAVSDLFSRG